MMTKRAIKGFSLLEVMVALSVVAIGFGAVYTLFGQSVTASESARFQQEAATLAELQISRWTAKPEEITSGDGDFGEDYPGWRWLAEVEAVKNKDHEALVKRLKRVRLEVTRSENVGRYVVVHYMKVEPK